MSSTETRSGRCRLFAIVCARLALLALMPVDKLMAHAVRLMQLAVSELEKWCAHDSGRCGNLRIPRRKGAMVPTPYRNSTAFPHPTAVMQIPLGALGARRG